MTKPQGSPSLRKVSTEHDAQTKVLGVWPLGDVGEVGHGRPEPYEADQYLSAGKLSKTV